MERAEYLIGTTKFILLRGDIATQETDAVVNAANSSLSGGGGVDGAIHRAAGPQLLEECRKIIGRIGSLPAGQAVVTKAGDLSARYIIHAVGPIWENGLKKEDEILTKTYNSTLEQALAYAVRSISFPSISTGAFRFPTKKAAEIALSTIFSFILKYNYFSEIRMVTWTKEDYFVYKSVAEYLMQ